MNNEGKGNSLEPEDIPSTDTGSKLEATKLPEDGPENTDPVTPIAIEKPEAVEAIEQQVDPDDRPRYQWTTNREQTKRLHLLLRNLSP
jgi:hypothetical protein